MFVEMFGKRVLGGEGLNELESHVAHVEMGEPDAGPIEDFTVEFGQAHLVSIEGEGSVGVAYNDGDVINFFEHGFSWVRIAGGSR